MPWGPIWTVKEIVTNAFGGSNDTENEERLILHNALAFALRGQEGLAASLAKRLKRSINKEISEKADIILNHIGKDYAAASNNVNNPWKLNLATVLAHLGFVSVIPALAIVLLIQSDLRAGDYATPPAPYLDATYLPTLPVESTSAPSPESVGTEIPTCKELPANGATLGGAAAMSSEGHVLEIKNGTAGPAIVKIRDAGTRSLVQSFYVESDNAAALRGIPDGVYVIQYAFGPSLADDCKSFTSISAAGEFPQAETFKTDVIDMGVYGTQLRWSRLSYTLYAVPAGNVRPRSLEAAQFNAD